MEHRESHAALARMKYLGTFQARARLATDISAGIARGRRISTLLKPQAREHAK